MEMDAGSKDRLQKIVLAAQAVVFDAARGQEFVDMMQQGLEGQLQAVLSVMSVIEQRTQIERPLLIPAGMYILMILIDFAGEALGQKPKMHNLGEVQKALIDRIAQAYGDAPGEAAAPVEGAAPTEEPM